MFWYINKHAGETALEAMLPTGSFTLHTSQNLRNQCSRQKEINLITKNCSHQSWAKSNWMNAWLRYAHTAWLHCLQHMHAWKFSYWHIYQFITAVNDLVDTEKKVKIETLKRMEYKMFAAWCTSCLCGAHLCNVWAFDRRQLQERCERHRAKKM